MELLIIIAANGERHDYSRFIKSKGYGWSREDLDTDKTVRVKSGVLRRQKIGDKRKLSYDVMNMTRDQLAQLDNDLSQSTYTAIYMDLHGKMQKRFYTSSFSATLSDLYDDNGTWDGASFNMIEV